ncbi:unnamed protein product [Albugo candida]|uniref:Uncharacterized protein n=1 Tax=Albugo candida TaxID=65357 RepID=A0A024FYL6_9STRA|nr:unnamed protein product [Albugo candida]|eukprot:CCI39502.1 unnamed protein product [Albugo candida]
MSLMFNVMYFVIYIACGIETAILTPIARTMRTPGPEFTLDFAVLFEHVMNSSSFLFFGFRIDWSNRANFCPFTSLCAYGRPSILSTFPERPSCSLMNLKT